ncbi:MAG: DUF2118 domain-containing protein [Omnitrophica WOR_2 bacterium]
MKYIATIEGREYGIEIIDDHHIRIDGVVSEFDIESVGDQPIYSLLVDGKSFEVHVYPAEEGWQVLVHGQFYPVTVEDERERRLKTSLASKASDHGEYLLKAPMPGLIVTIPVIEGQRVEKGDVLLILESMKMQNELKAPRAGQVLRIRVKPGESVEQKQTLLSIN